MSPFFDPAVPIEDKEKILTKLFRRAARQLELKADKQFEQPEYFDLLRKAADKLTETNFNTALR